MNRRTLLTVLTAAMLVLAGCAGSGGDSSPTNSTATPGDDIDPADGTDTAGDATGTVEFYVSDEPGQIDDFRHLNVTITQIGFERAGTEAGDEDAPANETEEGDSETEDGEENETETDDGTDNVENSESDDNETTTESGGHGEEDHDEETATDDAADDEETTDDTETDDESEGDDSEESDGDRADWVTHDVDSRTVDLTQLRGDNATLVGSPEIPAGNYSKVFVHVSGINATLADGSSVNVKLPSEKLQLNSGFSLEPNGSVSFVYDISVFKAGNSGKYILKPVISESGPDQNIEAVDEERDDEGERAEDTDDEREESDETTEPGADEEVASEADTAEADGGLTADPGSD